MTCERCQVGRERGGGGAWDGRRAYNALRARKRAIVKRTLAADNLPAARHHPPNHMPRYYLLFLFVGTYITHFMCSHV